MTFCRYRDNLQLNKIKNSPQISAGCLFVLHLFNNFACCGLVVCDKLFNICLTRHCC